MKKILPFLLLLLPFLANAQAPALPVDPATGKITYTAVIEAPGQTKDQLYAKAREWAVRSFQGSYIPLQVDDKEGGVLMATGTKEVKGQRGPFKFWYTVKIESKEGRLRYEFLDLQFEALTATKQSISKWPAEQTFLHADNKTKSGQLKPGNQVLFDATKDIIPNLITGLTSHMQATKSDW